MTKIFLSYPVNPPTAYGPAGAVELVSLLSAKLTVRGYSVATSTDLTPGAAVDAKEGLLDAIRQSSLVIGFVISDAPNVLFELGCASGLSKQIIAVRSSEARLPTYLSGVRYLSLRWPVSEAISDILEEVDRQRPSPTPTDRSADAILALLRHDETVLDTVSASEFEAVIAALLQQSGAEVRRADASDFGFDFYVQPPGGRVWLVEVKKYQTGAKVSIDQLQQLLGAVDAYTAARGIIITNTAFTKSALAFAELAGGKLELWDVPRLRNELLSAESTSVSTEDARSA